MKLTNTMRDAFIRAAMDDVPSVDYDEKLRKLAVKTAIDNLPAKVRAVWNDTAMQCHLETTYLNFRGIGISVSIPGACGDGKAREVVEKACADLVAACIEQKKQRTELSSRLRAVAYGMTTRKALADALPEFAKYLPADDPAAIKTLPVIANVVTDFVKAGWPKGKRRPAAYTTA